VSTPILSVTLRAPKERLHAGIPVPIEIEVRNISIEPVWVVGVLDGSEDGARYPRYIPQIALAGQVIAQPPPPEDPLVGPLRLTDFRLLQPDEAFDPTTPEGEAAWVPISTFGTFRPAIPGRYQFSLVLSTESQRPEEWLGKFGQDAERSAVLERVSEVPRLTARSSPLDIEIVA
jgi:hypothetical protein